MNVVGHACVNLVLIKPGQPGQGRQAPPSFWGCSFWPKTVARRESDNGRPRVISTSLKSLVNSIWFGLGSLKFLRFHVSSSDFMWFHLVSFDFIWFLVTSFEFILFHLIWFHVISIELIWFTWYHWRSLELTTTGRNQWARWNSLETIILSEGRRGRLPW
jgi:hypothetical protein